MKEDQSTESKNKPDNRDTLIGATLLSHAVAYLLKPDTGIFIRRPDEFKDRIKSDMVIVCNMENHIQIIQHDEASISSDTEIFEGDVVTLSIDAPESEEE